MELRGKFANVDLDALVDNRVVRTWLYFGMFWLMVTPSVGVLISSTFNYPDYLGSGNLELTFGRLRRSTSTVSSSAPSRRFSSACAIISCRVCRGCG